MEKKTLGETRLSRGASSPLANSEQCFIMIQAAIISPMGLQQSKYFHPVEDRIHHTGMDGLLRSCATGCCVDEAFTMDDLVDSISADTSGLRCRCV